MEDASKEVTEQAEKISYVIAGLSSYNKYFNRNLNLEFDETRVSSNIICTSCDRNQIVHSIEKSFTEYPEDKLKPANCLSTIANLQPQEQFLRNKRLSTRIKEIVPFLAVIISLLITVIELTIAVAAFAFPQ